MVNVVSKKVTTRKRETDITHIQDGGGKGSCVGVWVERWERAGRVGGERHKIHCMKNVNQVSFIPHIQGWYCI